MINCHTRNINDDDIYEKLQKDLNSDHLVLFAGSGLSSQACTKDGNHPPNWPTLLKKMADWCLKEDIIDDTYHIRIVELINTGLLADAGQEFEDIIEEKSQLQKCLAEAMLCNEAEVSEAHKLIAKINFRAYLTTNYDEFIEGAFWSNNGKRLQRFYNSTIEGVLDTYRNKDPFIFKLHGDINDPSSIILGRRSYDQLLQSNPYSSCLETIFSTSSILFIGFGYRDPDLEHITSRVAALDGRTKRHWMLVEENSVPQLKAKRFWKDLGINIIQYKSDEMHTEFVRFIHNLSVIHSPNSTTCTYNGNTISGRERMNMI